MQLTRLSNLYFSRLLDVWTTYINSFIIVWLMLILRYFIIIPRALYLNNFIRSPNEKKPFFANYQKSFKFSQVFLYLYLVYHHLKATWQTILDWIFHLLVIVAFMVMSVVNIMRNLLILFINLFSSNIHLI